MHTPGVTPPPKLAAIISRHCEGHIRQATEISMNGATPSIRVLLADDHPAMRDGLRYMIRPETDLDIVAEAIDGADCIEKFRQHRPDVSLIDLQMPKLDGLHVIATLREEFPDARLIVLTSYGGDARVARALMFGAKSYLLKTCTRAEILHAIHLAASDRIYVASELAHDVAAHRGSECLSPRELSVLRLIAAGKQNRSIGEALHVSEQTIKTRVKNILSKLQADDRTHAVSIAVKRGFLD
jgi:DNA-binding NarL/FixJ family response regulator